MSRTYPKAPLLGVGAIIFDEAGRVLLVERARAPAQGLWSVPGGAVEVGESLRQACAREVAEETGLEVEVGEQVEVVERMTHDPEGRVLYHFVIVDYLARVTGGTLRLSAECSRAQWVSLSGLGSLETTDGLGEVLARAAAISRRESR